MKKQTKEEMNQRFFTFGKAFVQDIIVRQFNKDTQKKMKFRSIYFTLDGEIVVTWWEER